MVKKEKVILHIGLHKTGTTTIQQFLAKNRAELGDLDYVCYTQSGHFREDGNSYFLVERENWYSSRRSCHLDIPLLLENINRSTKKQVMVSSEAFSWCVNQADIEELKVRLLTVSHEVLILAYVREPVSFAISAYTEGLKYPNSLSVLADYNYPCLSNHNLRNSFLVEHYTFGNLLPWKKVFHQDLIVRSLEQDKLLGNNLLVEILEIVGLGKCEKLRENALTYHRENESLNMLQVTYLTSLYRFLDKFKSSHKLKSLSYELVRRKLHWLNSNKKFSVSNNVAKRYFAEIRECLVSAREALGDSVETEFKYNKIHVNKISFFDFFKISFLAVVHVFLFSIYLVKRAMKLSVSVR
ncbi:hypothetical protein [Paraglaciecola chathamensis]|uniref:Sulfotransferase domain-containing protein n=1 Tax=Paraglaciecola chathamensis TaxID=368405 RepID=A0A8H9M4R7_9ALTE|nr:hypothetical protein [Paraglaciecola oceanifecundans]GGZ65644.1 hypothetical protein GCM10011274_24920 [Paraglaciecola oceanifecundans]